MRLLLESGPPDGYASTGKPLGGSNLQTITRVGIIDDHPLLRLGIRTTVAGLPGFVVSGEAGDRQGALELFDRSDLVTLDLDLEDVGGMSLLEQLRARRPGVKILVVSQFAEELYAERCVRMGASGFLAKRQGAEQLGAALRTVMAGEVYLSAAVLQGVARRMAGGGSAEDPLASLSDRELEVFELMGRGERSRDIAQVLRLSPKTVEAHQAKLRRKLGVENMLQLRRQALIWSRERVLPSVGSPSAG